MFRNSFRTPVLALLGLAAVVPAAEAGSVYITEWEYNGTGSAEFIEFTNLGTTAVDFTGWSFDDDSNTPGVVSLSSIGLLAAGESAILSEKSAEVFRAAWGLGAGVKIVGDNAANLGRNDKINLFDAGGNVVDALTYGDQNFPGSIRTDGKSGLPTAAALGANNPALWFFAAVGDAYGSIASSEGNVGNPGTYVSAVPVPAAAWLLLSGLGAMGSFARRRRAAV